VLSGWLTVIRNLFAPFQVLIEKGILFLDEEAGLSLPAKTGDTVAVLLFAPLFTVIAFSAAGAVMTSLAKKAGLDEAPKGKSATAAHAQHAKSRTSSVSYTENYEEKGNGSRKELV